eukprot:TRINITY_DN2418_c4_g1_i1.p1 TRINITY_DN2418_c4_g1~~TRINITY_DN2418_c4_g1_i1.p1  ORF type:complete len:372 (+),score=78.65 TRINITY_DN2418_c4_g1_i1:57-1118(+)
MPGYRNKRGSRKGKGKNQWGWDATPVAKVEIPGIVKGKCVDCGKLIQPGAVRCSCKNITDEPRTPESTSSSISCIKEKNNYVLLMESLGSVVSASGSDETSSICSVGELSKSSFSSLPKTPRSKLQGLLNKLSTERYSENYLAIKNIIFTEDICLTDVASLLLNHVMQTRHAQELYARLACDLAVAVASPTETMLQSPFRRELLGLLQQDFQMLLRNIDDGRRLKGLLSFIASLYKVAMVGTQTIEKILDSMLREAELRPAPDSLELELAMFLLKNVSETMAMKSQFRERLIACYDRTERLSCALCPRLRFFWEELLVQKERDLYHFAKADSCPIPVTSPISDEGPPPRYLTF